MKKIAAFGVLAASIMLTSQAHADIFAGNSFNDFRLSDETQSQIKTLVLKTEKFVTGAIKVITTAAPKETTGFRSALVSATKGSISKNVGSIKDLAKKNLPEATKLIQGAVTSAWAQARQQVASSIKDPKLKSTFEGTKFGFGDAAKRFFGAAVDTIKKGGTGLADSAIAQFKKSFMPAFKTFGATLAKAGAKAGFFTEAKKAIPAAAKANAGKAPAKATKPAVVKGKPASKQAQQK